MSSSYFHVKVNRNDVVSMSQLTGFQVITNAVFSVDTFFVMSGFMAAYLMLQEIDKRKNFSVKNIFQIYFHRIWRITPTYLVILLFLRYLYFQIGEGPLWPIASQMTVTCGNWWRNLLYINNMFSDTEECVAWSWYLANDMQFFIVTPWLLWLWSRRPKLGHLACCALIVASTLYCIIMTKKYNLDTYWLGSMIAGGAPDAAARGDYGDLIYRKPWARIQSYLVGVYAAYLHLRYGKKLVSSNLVVFFGTVISIICLTYPIFGLHREQLGDPLPMSGQIMYISFSRIAWSFAICFMIIMCANGKGSIINDFLSLNFWVPFSRMGLAAYLVHVILIALFLGCWKIGFYFSIYTVLYLYFSHLVATYAVAFPLTVLIESPLRLVEKLKIPKKK
jgi:peptidoglycan/LPS O-acetylase OafA/YrhL